MRRTPALIGVCVGVVISGVFAQTLAFDVASVKQNKSGTDEAVGGMSEPGGRFTVINTPLREIIRVAYRVQREQVVGGPSWIDVDRFDIAAKANGSPTPQELAMMLRPLLAERFKLAAHNETRSLPIYALVMASRDSKMGPHLRRSDAACTAEATGPPRANPSAPTEPPRQPCGTAGGPFGNTTARALTMSQIAFGLSRNVGRPVQDRTGLAGYFDYELTWTAGQTSPGSPAARDGATLNPNDSSIFTSLQEQLGLKLESTTAPFDVLVIDHVERPTED